MNVSDWSYHSEGGLHVIFKYSGHDPFFKGKALRVRKAVSSASSSSLPASENDFLRVLKQTLGNELLPEQTTLSTTRGLLSSLNSRLVEAHRPAHRTDQLLENQATVVLVEDLVSSGISVEIKPKWAKTPRHDLTGVHPLKRRFCRYCAHSVYKNPQKSAEEHNSSYCPLELYGNERKRAVATLLKQYEEGKAGNNLRIFIQGQLQKLDSAQSEGLQHLLVRALEKSAALDKIARLQSAFDRDDIETISPARDDEPEPSTEQWAQFFADWLAGRVPLDDDSTKRKAYALSAVFKDCSVFVCFPDLTLDSLSKAQDARPVVRIIDLDPKPLAKFNQWRELDRDIWEAMQAWLDRRAPNEEVRQCIK